MAATYDIESLLDDILTLLQAGLNTKIAALNTEKGDEIQLETINSDAYALQSLNGPHMNFNPFVFYGVQDIKPGDDSSPYGRTSMSVEVVVCIVLEDMGQDRDIATRLFRYQRALKEVIEDGFDSNSNLVKLSVQSLVPVEFTLMNSSNGHRAIGIQIQADLG